MGLAFHLAFEGRSRACPNHTRRQRSRSLVAVCPRHIELPPCDQTGGWIFVVLDWRSQSLRSAEFLAPLTPAKDPQQQGVCLTKLAQSALRTAVFAFSIFSLALASADAQTLSGTVTNGTTNKPAAGDEVILINLTNGMEIAANTKADSNGKFSFKLTGAAGPHLIRAVHQGVTYHQIAPPGVNSVEVNVYDVATKVTGLTSPPMSSASRPTAERMQGVRLFVVNNQSSPAKTQMNDHNFEFYAPPGQRLNKCRPAPRTASRSARKPFLRPRRTATRLTSRCVPEKRSSRWSSLCPTPARSRSIPSRSILPSTSSLFFRRRCSSRRRIRRASSPCRIPARATAKWKLRRQTKPGQSLGFTLTGNGVITESPGEVASGAARRQEQLQQQQQPPDQPQAGDNRSSDNRPGGGLGVPIDAPDALQQYRWPILGAFAVLLAIGGWVVTKRQPGTAVAATSTAKPGATSSDHSAVHRPTTPAATVPATSPVSTQVARSSMLLEALKEELFQLEVEKNKARSRPRTTKKPEQRSTKRSTGH